MFALTESLRYYLCAHPVYMHKGILSLYHLVKTGMNRNPVSGEGFLFLGKQRDCIKILHWEEGGFVLYQKRLERGRFEFPTDAFNAKTGALSWKYFILMMEGVRLKSVKFNRRYSLR
ncbi:MAG: IS66 family insertion sequence element accessory protein TnpB [Marinifilaceae bacterium]